MSGSPKYSEWELEQERQRQIEEERRRQARLEEERRRRREEEERRRQLAQRKDRLQNDLRAQETTLQDAQRSEYSSFSRSWSGHQDELRRLSSQIGRCNNLQDVATLERGLEAARTALRNEIVAARTAHQLEELRKEKERQKGEALAALAKATSQFESIDENRSSKFEPNVRASIQQMVREVELAIQQQHFSQAMQRIGALSDVVAKHEVQVENKYAAWLAAQQKAQEAISRLQEQVAGIEGDEVVLAWCRQDVSAIRHSLDQAQVDFAAENFDKVLQVTSIETSRIEGVLKTSQEEQLKEEKRAVVVNGLLEALSKRGFMTQGAQLAREGDFQSPVIIRAVRPDRRSIEVQVPHDGKVYYEVDGYAKRLESATSGTSSHSCDEAEAELEVLHQQLQQDFGIRMGEVLWDDKDPNRIRKGAKDLPGSGPAAQRSNRSGE